MKRDLNRSLPEIENTLCSTFQGILWQKERNLFLRSSNYFSGPYSAFVTQMTSCTIYLRCFFFIHFIKTLKSSSVFLPYFVSTQEIEGHPTPVQKKNKLWLIIFTQRSCTFIMVAVCHGYCSSYGSYFSSLRNKSILAGIYRLVRFNLSGSVNRIAFLALQFLFRRKRRNRSFLFKLISGN